MATPIRRMTVRAFIDRFPTETLLREAAAAVAARG
jgi:hypothetical protein